MLVNKVVLGERVDHAYKKDLIVTSKDGQFVSIELPEVKLTAKVLRNTPDGKLVPFRVVKESSNQEYEKDFLTPEQQKAYKDAMYSKEGLLLLNNLKNSRLPNLEDLTKFVKKYSKDTMEKVLNNRLVKQLLEPEKKKFKHRLLLRTTASSYYENRLSFKELGITKREIFDLFVQNKLIKV